MGLWYLKDSGFELIAYSNADHAVCHDDCKSTSGGLQFLGEKLVSWCSKKQTIQRCQPRKLSMYRYPLTMLKESTEDGTTFGLRIQIQQNYDVLRFKERYRHIMQSGSALATPMELDRLAKLSS
ncbi:retrovirus-related pol polyprotein from transposon TNT 1-94 [Tanacetum coccineum]